MRISRLQVRNFRNFQYLDVALGEQIVIVGENKVGKSNLIHALRLVLDPSLPDSARQLNGADFWDGLGPIRSENHVITISVDLADFEDDMDLVAVLCDHLVEPSPMVARITYVFQPVANLESGPHSDADFEFFTYGGGRPENRIGYNVRHRIPLDVLPALRDAEHDLATWTRSPMRPLLDEAARNVDRNELTEIAKDVGDVTARVLNVGSAPTAQLGYQASEGDGNGSDSEPSYVDDRPLRRLAARISSRIDQMAGTSQALDASLGFSPIDPERLIRAIRLFIDSGRRGVGDASLGSANLLYLALKSIELEQLARLGSRSHTFLAIEEPEAHLHPHLQRVVYRDFLRPRQADEEGDAFLPHRHQTVILTTHSPHIASVSPLRSIVVLRPSHDRTCTVGTSSAGVNLCAQEIQDIERYLDVKRGELLFARGVLLVEGDAEEYLVPAFARVLGHDLDDLGISVCSVSGVNFSPYVKLLGRSGLDIPFAVLTDRDPQADGAALGPSRVGALLSKCIGSNGSEEGTELKGAARARQYGLFMNDYTLEIDLFRAGFDVTMCEVLYSLSSSAAARSRASAWGKDPDSLDEPRFLSDIGAVGKGRYAQQLAKHVQARSCPPYIREAIEHVAERC